MSHKNQSGGRIFIGAILIIAGSLFLLRNFNFINYDFSHELFSFPSVLIFVGVLSFLNSTKKWFGIVLIVVGSAMHLSNYYDIDFSAFILPIILIGLGFMILVKHNRPKPIMPDLSSHGLGLSEEVRDDKLEVISIFGGSSKFFISEAFKGGNITSIFGGNEINLSGCKLAEGENIIDVVAIFGGTTIIIPKEWNVMVDVFPIFGGFGTKGKRDPMMVIEKDRVLRIKGIVVFGGGEIKLI